MKADLAMDGVFHTRMDVSIIEYRKNQTKGDCKPTPFSHRGIDEISLEGDGCKRRLSYHDGESEIFPHSSRKQE